VLDKYNENNNMNDWITIAPVEGTFHTHKKTTITATIVIKSRRGMYLQYKLRPQRARLSKVD